MKKPYNYRKILETFIVFSIVIMVFFYDIFNNIFGFYDEFFALFSFIIIVTASFFNQKIKLFKREIYIIISLFFIAIIGLISNYHSYKMEYITPYTAIIGDFINFFKAFVAYFAIRLLKNNFSSSNVINSLTKYAQIAFYIILFVLLIDIIFNIFPQYSRFGFHSYELFFTHTSRFSFAISFIFIMLFSKYYNTHKWKLVFVLAIGLLSLRVKFLSFFLLSMIFLFFGKKLLNIPRKTILIVLGLFTIILAFIFKDHLQMYFSFDGVDAGWSRGVILYYSFIIGNDFFPFGTGFGTYASYFSGKYYSWVYHLYGIDNVYGISKNYWGFIADQFWPMVLGQFGYLGLIAFVNVVYNYLMIFIINIKKSYNLIQKQYMYASVLGLLLLLIDSTSDAIFTQNRAVVIFVLFGLFVNSYKESNEIY